MKEKILIIFVASILGLLITTIAFYIYQTTKSTTADKKLENPIVKQENTPSPQSAGSLIIDEPKEDSVTDKRTVQIKGRAQPGSTIVVSSNTEDIAGQTADSGAFSFSIDIEAGVNKIITRAIQPDGSEIQDLRIVTFSTEEF